MPKLSQEDIKKLKDESDSFDKNMKETLKKKSWYKIVNLERPGDAITIGFNGLPTYQFVDGAEALIPDAVADAINSTVKVRYKQEDGRNVPYEMNRFQAFPSKRKEEEIKNSDSKSDLAEALKNKKDK